PVNSTSTSSGVPGDQVVDDESIRQIDHGYPATLRTGTDPASRVLADDVTADRRSARGEQSNAASIRGEHFVAGDNVVQNLSGCGATDGDTASANSTAATELGIVCDGISLYQRRTEADVDP